VMGVTGVSTSIPLEEVHFRKRAFIFSTSSSARRDLPSHPAEAP
jgi:hypothetical protein